MGADTFETYQPGEDMQKAFQEAVEEAQWEYGHGGYTGTIAEKGSVVRITPPADVDAAEFAGWALNAWDETWFKNNVPAQYQAAAKAAHAKVEDKWGPAGAVKYKDGWFFFGWASS